ncbi:MAG: dienelactone hydrolase family protein [Actinobacteria bacterium]|nr:dienelactone hydrolase family protein [Actinomycetota bacterium]
MHSEDIEYFIEGVRYLGHLAVPDGTDARPAVLVCHEGPGLTGHPKARARRLADELGYLAFALDYYGDGVPPPIDEMPALLGALRDDPTTTRQRAFAGLDVLLAHPRADRGRVGVIGYCFGGTMALELGRAGAAVQAIVGFHSGLANPSPGDEVRITGKVLVCIGVDDPIIPPSQRATFEEEMNAAGVDWQMILYSGAGHSFTNKSMDGSRPGFVYHEPSDRRSWQAMVNLFDEVFG